MGASWWTLKVLNGYPQEALHDHSMSFVYYIDAKLEGLLSTYVYRSYFQSILDICLAFSITQIRHYRCFIEESRLLRLDHWRPTR